MVVGNSMVYYGNCVVFGNQGKPDEGYLYQLIKQHGENATVIDPPIPPINSSKKTTDVMVEGDQLTATLKKLKAGQRYYVKVRAYRFLSDARVHGKYSKMSKIRVKK